MSQGRHLSGVYLQIWFFIFIYLIKFFIFFFINGRKSLLSIFMIMFGSIGLIWDCMTFFSFLKLLLVLWIIFFLNVNRFHILFRNFWWFLFFNILRLGNVVIFGIHTVLNTIKHLWKLVWVRFWLSLTIDFSLLLLLKKVLRFFHYILNFK